jgi:hypothetical protein
VVPASSWKIRIFAGELVTLQQMMDVISARSPSLAVKTLAAVVLAGASWPSRDPGASVFICSIAQA